MTKQSSNNRPKKTKSLDKRIGLLTKVGLVLVLAGTVVGGGGLFKTWLDQRSDAKPFSEVVNNSQVKDNGTPLISGDPAEISVPSVNIDLKVIPGQYYPATKSWTLSWGNAQYAVMTAKPNNKSGDTFIYGHALTNVFGRLPKVQPGAEAIVTTSNGHTFIYKFVSSTVIPPNNTDLFKYKGKPILVLQTCTGVYFQNRQLFVFNLSEVS